MARPEYGAVDLDALVAAIDTACATGADGVVYDELAVQGWRRPTRRLPTREQIMVDVDPATGCSLRRGRRDAGGYGLWRGQAAHRASYRVFVRASYRVFVGPIPARHHIDHLCRTRVCVNAPGGHLEAVTPGREHPPRNRLRPALPR